LAYQRELTNNYVAPHDSRCNMPSKIPEFSFIKKDSAQPILRDWRMLQDIFEKQNTELVGARSEIQILRNKNSEKERFQSVLTAVSPDAIIATDKNLDIIEWNKASEELFGWKAEEALGKASSGEIRSHIIEAFGKEEVIDGLAGRGCWTGSLPVIKRNGQAMAARVSVGVIWDQAGSFDGLVAVYQIMPQKEKTISLSNQPVL
jgi:PAS domain S-box-containing protein